MRKTYRPLITREMVAALLVSHYTRIDPSILLGVKSDGSVAGFLMPPGGKFELDEFCPFEVCKRETWEETNLWPLRGTKVAELRILRKDLGIRLKVHVILYTQWTGRLRRRKWKKEFKSMRFFKFSEIPWGKLPPLDEKWMKEVLFRSKRIKHRRRLVHIRCGKSRKDVLSIRTRPLH